MQKLLDYKLPEKRKEEIIHKGCQSCCCCCCLSSVFATRELVYVDVLKEGAEFWISLKDAITCSQALILKTDIRGWHHIRLQGRWRGMSAGGPPGENFTMNPRYQLGLQWHPFNPLKRSRVLISMSGSLPDATIDGFNKDDHGVNLQILHLNGEPLTENVNPAQVRGTTGAYSCDRVTLETELPRVEDQLYTVIPSKGREGTEGTFVINIFAQVPMLCEEESTGITLYSELIRGKKRADVMTEEEPADEKAEDADGEGSTEEADNASDSQDESKESEIPEAKEVE